MRLNVLAAVWWLAVLCILVLIAVYGYAHLLPAAGLILAGGYIIGREAERGDPGK